MTGLHVDRALLKKHSASAFTHIFRAIFLVVVGFITLYPVLYMISSSFMSISDTLNPITVWLPSGLNWFNFQKAFELMDYATTLGNTMLYVIPCVLLQLASCLFIAYGFARFKFRGRAALFILLIFNIIVPAKCYIIPTYVLLADLHLLDSYLQFYVQAALGVGIRSALYIFILRQFFMNLPRELEEAAFIDGCSPLQTFFRVMVPNVSSALMTVGVFSFVWYYNDFTMSGMLLNSRFPLAVAITNVGAALDASAQHLTGQASIADIKILKGSILAAACLITVIPLIALYIFVQRYFTEGVERTGIVG